MFDYESYSKRLEFEEMDWDVDFPISFEKFNEIFMVVKYLSGVTLVFDLYFFLENTQFICCKPLLTVLKFKNQFEN